MLSLLCNNRNTMHPIWNLILPRRGGSVRRWLRFKEAMWDKTFDRTHILKGPINLFDFSNDHDAADAEFIDLNGRKGGWRISDDETIGGFSWCNMKLIQSAEEYQQFMKGKSISKVEENHVDNPDNKISEVKVVEQPELKSTVEQLETSDSDVSTTVASEMKDKVESAEEEEFIPFIRWWGKIDTRIGMHTNVQRSGFCAIRSPEFIWSGAYIGAAYNALELTFRTDGRTYVVNLRLNTAFAEDLYQAVLPIPATHLDKTKICPKTGGHFDRMVFRFEDHFHHTFKGRLMEIPKVIDGAIRIENVGVILMDDVDGKFEFDLARIRVVNVTEYGYILGEDDDDAPY